MRSSEINETDMFKIYICEISVSKTIKITIIRL